MGSHAHNTHHNAGSHSGSVSNPTTTTAPAPTTSGGGHHHGHASAIVAADNTAVIATAGNDKIVAGANDTMTGGGGNDEFVIGANSGSSEITDFGVSGAGAGIIDLRHSGVASTTFTDLLTHITEVNGNAVVDLGNGNSLTLDKVDMATLTADNFELPGVRGGHGSEHHGHGNTSIWQSYIKIIGTNGNDSLTATDANTIIFGHGGNDTLTAGAGNDLLVGGAGDDSLVGGAGNDTLVGGGGNDIMTGGGGTNVFSISGEHGAIGNTEIADFVSSGTGAGVVRLEDTGLHFAGFNDFMTHVSMVGANTVIDLGNSHTITLDNVTSSSLSAADFVFG